MHPTGVSNSNRNLEISSALPPNQQGEKLDFSGKVALVTGAGAGLGRAYAHAFAKVGAKVVVNDVKNAQLVAQEITDAGGDAVGVNMSVEDGAGVVDACIKAYGRIDIIINNAGILRDKAFTNMTEQLWESVLSIHLRGTYSVTKAAWPHFVRQRYGRVLNITSTTGIYGKFGQANYSTAVGLNLSPCCLVSWHGMHADLFIHYRKQACSPSLAPLRVKALRTISLSMRWRLQREQI